MKTITVRIDDDVYNLLKKAADGERRTISNFMENASLSYLASEMYVSDEEMEQILDDAPLMAGLKKGMSDARKGKYRIVR
jgi:predicted transcriptional regulator